MSDKVWVKWATGYKHMYMTRCCIMAIMYIFRSLVCFIVLCVGPFSQSIQDFLNGTSTSMWLNICLYRNRPNISYGSTLQNKSLCIIARYLTRQSEGFDSCDRPSNLKLDSNRQFCRPCDRENWWMTSKNNRAFFLYYVKLFASFQIHWWMQAGFTVQKGSIRVEIVDMWSRVTLKFDGWPWKTIGHLFYATSSFVQHFVPISEFKLELQSGNAQFGSKSTIFFSCVTFKLDRWP